MNPPKSYWSLKTKLTLAALAQTSKILNIFKSLHTSSKVMCSDMAAFYDPGVAFKTMPPSAAIR